MSSAEPLLISDINVSRAWARVLLHVMAHSGKEISPLVVSIVGDGNNHGTEVASIREALDAALESEHEKVVETVAGTIFPLPVWRLFRGNRHRFFETYRNALPRYAGLDRLNYGGNYFSRLIAFDRDARTGMRLSHIQAGAVPEDGNQLEHIIKTFREGKIKRDSALQASVFDPARDHSRGAQQGFPCMQHVTFVKSDDDSLVMNAFYATQQLYRKAYGNYLGLLRLGYFMAGEMGLPLGRLNVFVGVEKLGPISKSSALLKPVIDVAQAALA